MFDPGSRYYGLSDKTLVLADGQKIVYKERRLLPAFNAMEQISQVTLQTGDRLDLLAARLLGDPLRYWQICDGTDVLNPPDLEKPGQVIVITDTREGAV